MIKKRLTTISKRSSNFIVDGYRTVQFRREIPRPVGRERGFRTENSRDGAKTRVPGPVNRKGAKKPPNRCDYQRNVRNAYWTITVFVKQTPEYRGVYER